MYRQESWSFLFVETFLHLKNSNATLGAMPTGSIREFALDTERSYRTVYRKIDSGRFNYPNAELIEEKITVYRVKWKKPRKKPVNS